MFAALGAAARGAAGRAAGGGGRLVRRGGGELSHARGGRLESGQSSVGSGRSFDFMRTVSGAERLQQGEGERSAFSRNSGSSINSDVMKAQFREQLRLRGGTDRPNVSSNMSVSEVSRHSSEFSRSSSEIDDNDDDARSDVSNISNSSFISRRSGEISDNGRAGSMENEEHPEEQEEATSRELVLRRPRDAEDSESDTSSVEEIVIDPNSDARSTSSRGSDDGSEHPSKSDYAEHTEKNGKERNRLKKDQATAKKNEEELRAFLRKMRRIVQDPNWRDPSSKQMERMMRTQALMILGGELQQVESKMAPTPRE